MRPQPCSEGQDGVAAGVGPAHAGALHTALDDVIGGGLDGAGADREAVEAAQTAGERVSGLPIDAHWNRRGHEIAAGVINAWLEKNSSARTSR